MWLVITNTNGNTVYSQQIISNGIAVQPSTSGVSLTTNTYYIGIVVQPVTPLPPSANSIATITVYLSNNVVSPSPVPLPYLP